MQALIDSFDVPAADVADEIENNGAACLSAVLTESWLCAAQDSVQSYLPINGRDEVFIEHPAGDKHAFCTSAGNRSQTGSLARVRGVRRLPKPKGR